jgi:hypothetical protein
MHRFFGRIKIKRQCQIRTVILEKITVLFFARKPFNNGIFTKEKFQSIGDHAKIGAFSTGLYAHCSLRNFYSENNAPLST